MKHAPASILALAFALAGSAAVAQTTHATPPATPPAGGSTATATTGASATTTTTGGTTPTTGAATAPTATTPAGTAPTAATATAGTVPGAPVTPADGALPAGVPPPQQSIRIHDVQAYMDSLTHDIDAAHDHLNQLASQVIEGATGGGRLIVDHDNEMSSQFLLVRLSYALDGAPIADKADEGGSLSGAHQIPIFDGAISAGDHVLRVDLEYQGNGYGIFAYVTGYHFHIRSNLSFHVDPGQAMHVQVTGYERTGAEYAPEERPQVRFNQEAMTLQQAQARMGALPANAPAQPGNH